MRIVAVCFLLCASMAERVQAQTNEILRAPQADFIYLSLKPTGSSLPFDYTLDRRASGEWSKPLKPGMLITTRQQDGMNAVLEFLNPLVYSWTVSDSAVDSGVGKASASFLAAVTAQFGAIGGISPVTVPTSSGGKADVNSGGGAGGNLALMTTIGGSTALIGWRQWLDAGRASCFLDPNTESRVRAQSALVEEALYGATKAVGSSLDQGAIKSAEDYRRTLFAAVAGLRDASNMETLRAAIVNARKTASDLEGADQRVREYVLAFNVQMQGAFKQKLTAKDDAGKTPAETKGSQKKSIASANTEVEEGDTTIALDREQLLKLLKSEFRKADSLQRKEIAEQVAATFKRLTDDAAEASATANEASCESFQRYTAATLQSLTLDANDLLIKRSSVVRELRSLLASLDRLLATVRSVDNDFPLGTFLPNENSDRLVCISVQKRDVAVENERVTVAELPAVRSCLRLSRSRRIVFEVAPGVAYANVQYARFGTASGAVARATDEVQHTVPVVMLNVLPSVTDGRVIGQVGVGSARDYPAFLIGAGVRFSAAVDWSIAAGAIWSWDRYLKTLKIGDPVTGTAAVESDTGRELRQRPGFYVGIQVGIP